jgi:hypothetical protein
METHRDSDAQVSTSLEALERRAAEMTERGENIITAGAPGEAPLSESRIDGMTIREMPQDPLALRISIGGGRLLGDDAYLVYRGPRQAIHDLLRRAIEAMD